MSAIDGVGGQSSWRSISEMLVQDIDTPEMLAQAEKHLRARVPRTERILKEQLASSDKPAGDASCRTN